MLILTLTLNLIQGIQGIQEIQHPDDVTQEDVMLNLIHYHPTGGCGFGGSDGFAVSLFSTKKRRIQTNEPVEAQFISIGAAFQTDPSESDSEAGKGAWCFQQVACFHSRESRIGVDVCSSIALDQSE